MGDMNLISAGRRAGGAIASWWRAVTLEGLCVAVLWLAGLLALRVPLAPMWALIGGLMCLVPGIGGVFALVGPVLAMLVAGHELYQLGLLLGLYALIVVIDQLLLQPYLLKRTSRVPLWASILVPIVAGFVIPFWGILLAPPLLAVIYAFVRPKAESAPKAG
jgi:predicted PurR-regulated permease PerM